MKIISTSIILVSLFFIFTATACSDQTEEIASDMVIEEPKEDDAELTSEVIKPNILLIIADDMGMDATPYATQLNSQKPVMPTLIKLYENGVRFTNAWAYPTCTPTRGTILTGKQARTTGLLAPSDQIDFSEISLQSYINTKSDTDYATAVFGKWHLSKTVDQLKTNFNIDTYKGSVSGGVPDYYNGWTLNENGNTSTITDTYTTTAYTDFAIDWIQEQTKPWFCWVAYNAAHTPFHKPKKPDSYTTQGNSNVEMYLSMLEAMDYEIDRLINSLSEEEKANTTIIFIGDNGTPGQAIQTPFDTSKAKGSIYNGGINIPLVVSGYGVNRKNSVDLSLIQSTDLYATIADLCGVNQPNIYESISFKALLSETKTHDRLFNYAESDAKGQAFGGYTIRNKDYKFTYNKDDDVEYLFKMTNDYAENHNLLEGDLDDEAQNALITMKKELERIKKL